MRTLKPAFAFFKFGLILLALIAGCNSSTTTPDPDTPTAVATSAATAIPSAAPTSRFLLQDNFTDPNSGWPVESSDTFKVGYHPPEVYHVQVSVPGLQHVSLRPRLTFDDYTVETEAFVDSSTGNLTGEFRYGLALRASQERYYAFTISPANQKWTIFKAAPNAINVLAEGQGNLLRGLSAKDQLRVDADGEIFTFWINGRVVGRVTDSSYTSGNVGFVVENLDQRLSHIHFDSITVRPLKVQQDVLFEDNFSEVISSWPVEQSETYKAGYHPPDVYHVEVSSPKLRMPAFLRDRTFDDFTVVATVQVDHPLNPGGDFQYGVAIRGSQERYYAFMISPHSNKWTILKSLSNGTQVLQEGSENSINGFRTADELRVQARGANLAFYINGHFVAQVTDSQYSSGKVGFVVETFDEPLAHIHYNHLAIFRNDAQVPVPQSPPATDSPTPSVTPTLTPTSSATPTPTDPPTSTPTPSATPTPTDPPTSTPTPSATPTPTDPPTSTPTPSATPTPTDLPSATPTLTTLPSEVPTLVDNLPTHENMINIKPGTYTIGVEDPDGNHAPQQPVPLAGYWIDRFEVKNRDYATYLSNPALPRPHDWVNGVAPPGKDEHPVHGVTWQMALDYCTAVGKRLPTETEWEVAARGTRGLLFPWGDDEDAVALPPSDTYPVGSMTKNQSDFGVFDMAGNVWEWVDEPYVAVPEGSKLMRGGANNFLKDMAYRLIGDPTGGTMIRDAGFRCAADQ